LEELLKLDEICKKVRRDIILQIGMLGVGHAGGSLSVVELLVVLYKKYMRVDPKNPKKAGRDRLFVSKGHSGPAVYAVLCDMGFFDHSWLETLNKPGTRLPSHCDMNLTPGIDMTTGSLGQGLSCAIGACLGSRLNEDHAKIYSILGDGELQEGQIWEAAMFASHQKLSNLMVFIDYNKAQIDGLVSDVCGIEPLALKWRAFGWDVLEVRDGNSCSEIDATISGAIKSEKPCAVILNTIKGFGVSFVEELEVENHSMYITNEQMKEAVKELGF
jgi:transketolase